MKKFDEKKEEIKRASRKMFATYGYNKTTLEDIAGSLKMKKNSLYYYFENKEALFRELIEDEIKIHLERQAKILEKNIPADQKLILSVEELFHFIHEKTTAYLIKVSSYVEIEKVIEESFPDYKKREGQTFKEILKQGIEQGVFVEHNVNEKAKDISYLMKAISKMFYCNTEIEFMSEIDFARMLRTTKKFINYIIEAIRKK